MVEQRSVIYNDTQDYVPKVQEDLLCVDLASMPSWRLSLVILMVNLQLREHDSEWFLLWLWMHKHST